jgi:hypothetical protein
MHLAGVAMERVKRETRGKKADPFDVQEITRPLHEMPDWRDFTHRATPSGRLRRAHAGR